MQRLDLFCVYDCKMELYLSPFTAMNTAVAVRVFATAVLQEGHDFNSHADDYSMWQIGEFDQETGGVKAIALKNVVQGHHILNKQRNAHAED